MGLWVSKPRFERGERVLMKPGANRSQGNRAIGGRLFVTDRRVIFVPNIVDRLTGATTWTCGLSDVGDVGTAERSLNEPFSGAARRRLEVRLAGGGKELFVVNHVESVGKALRGAVANNSAPPASA